MTTESFAALLLIVLPVAFNVTFTLLARSFSYPAILRQPAGTILTRFSAGGTQLVVQWWAFALTALLMVPLVVLVGSLFAEGPLRTLAIATGLLLDAPDGCPGHRQFCPTDLARLAGDSDRRCTPHRGA
jgi:hypothetical protein